MAVGRKNKPDGPPGGNTGSKISPSGSKAGHPQTRSGGLDG